MAAELPHYPFSRPILELLDSPNEGKYRTACPDCGGELKHLGEDVSEMLEIESIRFKVIRQVRPKLACTGCERIVQAEAPSLKRACSAFRRWTHKLPFCFFTAYFFANNSIKSRTLNYPTASRSL